MIVNIKRFLNGGIRFDSFEVDLKKGESVLELLERVKNIDRSVTYRSFCRSSICGTCAVKVNDKTVLACKTKVEDIIEHNEIIIEPVDRSRVIKDLVVDHSYMEKGLKKNKLWFVGETRSDVENLQTPDEFKKYEKQTDCIMCMACYFECEALDYSQDFAAPFVFTKYFRFVFDSRDKSDSQERIDLAKENGLYSCINCQKCVMVCPKGIAGAFDIKMLQNCDVNKQEYDNFNENGMFF
jgi:succinate dehydrogenase/fumarate reductase iron-sulfur protein